MRLELTLSVFMLLGGAACQSTGESQDPRDKWGENPMENPEFMAQMTEAMTPGEAHQEIAKGVGTWDVESKMYMSPGSEPEISTATAESRMILGGRYLVQDFTGEAMGAPFEGMLILGYDNLAGEYFSIWMDTWSTWSALARGVENEKGEVNQIGTMRDVLTPDGRTFRHVTRFPSPDEQQVRMYDSLPDGTEWLVMEMTYRRRR